MTDSYLNADALPYSGWARFVTFVYGGLMDGFMGLSNVGRVLDRAQAAAEVSRNLYSLSDITLASYGLTRVEVPNYVVSKLSDNSDVASANSNSKAAA